MRSNAVIVVLLISMVTAAPLPSKVWPPALTKTEDVWPDTPWVKARGASDSTSTDGTDWLKARVTTESSTDGTDWLKTRVATAAASADGTEWLKVKPADKKADGWEWKRDFAGLKVKPEDKKAAGFEWK